MTKKCRVRPDNTQLYPDFVASPKFNPASGAISQTGRVYAQARHGLLPKVLKTLVPGMNCRRVIQGQGTAGLVILEAANRMQAIGQNVGVGELSKVVRGLADFDQMGVAGKQLHQPRRAQAQLFRFVQHDADSTQALRRKEGGQKVDRFSFVKPRCGEITIENQQLACGASDDRIAGLSVGSLAGDQGIGRFHGRTQTVDPGVIIIGPLFSGIEAPDADCDS